MLEAWRRNLLTLNDLFSSPGCTVIGSSPQLSSRCRQAAVLRIVSVLDWEDRVRSRLQAWLSVIHPESWAEPPYPDYQQLFIRCSFPIDYVSRSLQADTQNGDCDPIEASEQRAKIDGIFFGCYKSAGSFLCTDGKQLLNVAQLPFVFRWIAAMPDVHWGIGATVGSVIPTKGAIIPAAVGVDIGCGMMAVETSLAARHLPDNLHGIREAIEKAVPHGRTHRGADLFRR